MAGALNKSLREIYMTKPGTTRQRLIKKLPGRFVQAGTRAVAKRATSKKR